MKKLLLSLLAGLTLLGGVANAQVSSNYWKLQGTTLSPLSSSWTVNTGNVATSTFGFITATTTNATSTFAGDVYITGNLRVTGNFFAPVAISAASDIRPSADVTYSLGTGALRWLNTYTQNLFATSSTVTGNSSVGGSLGVGTSTFASTLSAVTSSALNSVSAFLVATSTGNLFEIKADGSATLTATSTGTGLTIGGVTSGTALNLNSVTSGTAISITGLTNGSQGINLTVGGTTGTGYLCNTTTANQTTARCFSASGSANMTGDYSGYYFNADSVKNVTAAATRTFSGGFLNISPSYTLSSNNNSILNVTGTTTQFTRTLSNASTGSGASLTVTSPLVAIANIKGAGTGTTTDSSIMVDLLQAFTGSSGTVFRVTNTGTGNAATFSGGSIAVGEFAWGTGTSTSMTVDWKKANTQNIRIGTSGVTITFTNATTTVGAVLKLVVCNPPTGTAGAITWGNPIYWVNKTAPTQTTTANNCDVYSFISTNSTSTPVIFGSASTNF